MKQYPLSSDRVSLAVTEIGGHLSDITFTLPGGRKVSPMHVAPWANEALADDTPPILRVLRGDFFCAPFGSSDLIRGETRVHGLPANGVWRPAEAVGNALDFVLDGDVLGASVAKHVEVRPAETVVYQRHVLTGGSGRIPIGHHAMLRAETPLQLAFSPWTMALTPPEPIEEPPQGRPLLVNDQRIANLRKARRPDGRVADLTTFPTEDGYEALWMVLSDPALPFAWTAATAADQGWVWFSLKDQRVLPQTLLWFSNGGRDYPPWNGRHKRAIGLEEICGYFHLGHAASTGDNPVAAAGSPTAVELRPDTPLVVSYAFGVAPAPLGFGTVKDIQRVPGGVKLVDSGAREIFAACDLSFVTG